METLGFSSVICCHCCSVSQSCTTLCNPMDCSMPGFPVLCYLLEFAQTYVHWIDDAIQMSHPLSLPSPPALNLSQHQGLFQWVGSSHQVAKVLSKYYLSVMSSANSEFYFFPSNLDAFYFFFFSIAVARTSNTMLNRSGESEHPCLILYLRGKAFSFSPFSIMLLVGLS